MSRDIDALHLEAFWMCVVIAMIVFGAMIYSLIKLRQSPGKAADPNMLHSTKIDVLWTLVSVLIVVVVTIPVAELILKMEH
jgi:cytochrome c oxidase subunit 2